MKTNLKKITTIFTSMSIFLANIVTANAQLTNPVTGNLGNDAEKAASGETFVNYFVNIWNTIITIGGLLVLFYFIWGAIEWITAGGDASKIEKARSRILQSIIGLILLVSSFVILGFISQLFFGDDFSILNLTFTKAGGTK